MAHGLPAVGFEVDGVKQLIKTIAGWLCPTINATEFAKTLTIALRSKALFKEFGKTASETAKTYSEDDICQLWNKLLLSIER